jgi:SAM-dependent methyltransferase
MTEVTEVYNKIAEEFSRTRHSVWNGCRIFLDELPINSSLADIGCGNGKNMLYRKDLKSTGMDLYESFIEICKSRGLYVIKGDIRSIPFESNSFDNSISIAVIHHLEKREDRVKAIEEILRITKDNGQILISVWAFEQDEKSKRKFLTQDEMVSFQIKKGEKIYRYYHLYRKGEIEEELNLIEKKNFEIVKSYSENNNYILVLKKLYINPIV